MKIRILHVIKTLGLGGAETNLLNLIQAFDKERFEIYVAYSFGGEIEDKFRSAGIKIFKYARGNHKIKSFESIFIIFRLIKYILENKIQIIHTHIFNAHIWAGIAAKFTGRKIVEHVHDFRYLDSQEFIRRRGENRQYKFVSCLKDFSDRVIVLTKQNYEFLISRGLYSSDKVIELQNGIPVILDSDIQAKHNNLKQKYDITENANVILSPVRVSPEKNVDLILRIAPQVIKECPQAMFLIAGDGPLLEDFRSQIRSVGLSNNVRMIGFESDIRGLLVFTDIFLLPSFLELHSIAILEAMSMRVPIIVSENVGCNSEFIENWQNGVLLDPFKDEGWAEALIKLLKDKNSSHSIGENGYTTCLKRFDINHTVRKIEEIYHELAG